MTRPTANQETAANYLRENFHPQDRLAIVLIHKRAGSVLQRLASAQKIAAEDFQAWLRQKNAERYEVYVSMNALRDEAKGRTKEDVAVVRHVFLDLDQNGTATLERLLKRQDLAKPNFVLGTSPDKWQVVWRVEGFTKEQAEEVQRNLARETGADPAATDVARVLRLPGFFNHKYSRRHLVGVQKLSDEIYNPARFPKYPASDLDARIAAPHKQTKRIKGVAGHYSQSERDWAYAKRALARGEPQESVIATLANYRRYDKHNPQYYAELTVRKAAQVLQTASPDNDGERQPER